MKFGSYFLKKIGWKVQLKRTIYGKKLYRMSQNMSRVGAKPGTYTFCRVCSSRFVARDVVVGGIARKSGGSKKC